MAATEQFSLRWNNFHSNLTNGFHELLQASDLVDVTMAVDGYFLYAHKIVLSICSPYFKQMFKLNPCKHPIVILKDVTRDNMKDILEFMYLGEVNILRENLESFLRTAELLQVKGLTGDDSQSETSSKKDENVESLGETDEDQNYNQIMEADVSLTSQPANQTIPQMHQPKRQARSYLNNATNKKSKVEQNHNKSNQSNKVKMDPIKIEDDTQSELSNIKVEARLDSDDITKDTSKCLENSIGGATLISETYQQDNGKSEEKVTKNAYMCEICMKMFSRRDHLRTHEKNIHGEDKGPFACVMCSQLYKNAESLRKHLAKFHYQRPNDQPNSSNKVQLST